MAALNATNGTNATYDPDREALLARCDLYRSQAFVYAGTCPIWIGFLIYWIWSISWANARHAQDLHRMLVWVPLIIILLNH